VSFLAVYGHVNIDTILLLEELPERNHTVPALGEIHRIGGTGGTIARAAATLGVPTALAAFIGDDFPPEYRKLLGDLGLDLTDLRTLPGRTPHCWLLSVPGGDSTAVFDQGALQNATDLPLLDYAYLSSTWVHITTGDPKMHLEVAKGARAAKKKIVFDPAQELHYRYEGRTLERFLESSDIFITNATELPHAMTLLGYADPVQLHDHVETIIVTQGAQGLTLYHDGKSRQMPACPVRGESKRETTGAGDVMRGGLYAGLNAGQSLEDALRWGAVAASLFLEHDGARLPTRAELDERLRTWTG
jgi:sugar/nucleoside kinase (ribokinase family)